MRKKRERDEVGGAGRKKRRNELLAGPSSVLAQAQQLDSVSAGGYRPKTRESREAYDRILSIVLDSIGSQPQDILRGAADEVLAILNDDSMREPDKQAETHKLLSKMKMTTPRHPTARYRMPPPETARSRGPRRSLAPLERRFRRARSRARRRRRR